MAMIIGPVIKAHDGTTKTIGIPDAEEIARRLHIMNISTLALAGAFLLISFIAFLMMRKYLHKESKGTDGF